MMIFQCNVSFQGVHGSKAFKTVAMAMLVTFARVTFVWIGSAFLLLTLPKPVLLRFFVHSCNHAESVFSRKAILYEAWLNHPSIHQSIHPYLFISLSFLYLSLYIIIIYYNLSYQPIYPSINHFVLTPLQTEAANICFFSTQPKKLNIFQRPVAPSAK